MSLVIVVYTQQAVADALVVFEVLVADPECSYYLSIVSMMSPIHETNQNKMRQGLTHAFTSGEFDAIVDRAIDYAKSRCKEAFFNDQARSAPSPLPLPQPSPRLPRMQMSSNHLVRSTVDMPTPLCSCKPVFAHMLTRSRFATSTLSSCTSAPNGQY